MDVFSQLKFTDPGLFGLSYSRFRSRYAFMGGFQGKQILGYINQDEMTEKLKQVMIRVRAEDVLKLTNFEDIYFTFDLSAVDRKIYNEIQNEFCTQLASGMITVSNALTKLLRLQQITCGHLEGHIIGDTKKSVLMDFLMDIAPDENIVVFCLFHQDLNAIQDACKQLGIPCAELSGRKDELDIWQKGHARVLAAQIRSGKEGIDLTRARYNIYYSEGFSLGDYSQSRKRTDRPGQTRDGYYIHLIAEKTVDEKIIKALRSKQDIVENVLWQFKQD
jgi:SNF2 family DNA or RNA helicase